MMTRTYPVLQTEGANVKRDKLMEMIHSYESKSFCNSSQIRKVYMKKVKSKHKEINLIPFSKPGDLVKNANRKFHKHNSEMYFKV